jgi:hypothetical protein
MRRDPTMVVDPIEARLWAWSAWLTGGGRQAVGYPVKSVLHESWMPPTPGQTPTMASSVQSSDRREREMHLIIEAMSLTLQNTLVAVYVMRASVAEQERIFERQHSTIRARVERAKGMINRALDRCAVQ